MSCLPGYAVDEFTELASRDPRFKPRQGGYKLMCLTM